MKLKILYIINNINFFLSHRLPIAVAAQNENFEIHIASPDNPAIAKIKGQGFIWHGVELSRSGKNPIQELKTFFAIRKIIKQLKPDIVHLVTIKPVLYGGIAARMVGAKAVVAAISGLGSGFSGKKVFDKVTKFVISILYKIALKQKNIIVIFQNSNDKKILTKIAKLPENKTVLIPGSGVDLEKFKYLPEPEGKPVIVMASRLLRDKGVPEFILAAKTIANGGTSCEFILAGEIDPGNPSSITKDEIDLWKSEGFVKIAGFCSDIAGLFRDSNIVVFPSVYNEGLPKVLIEAAACGRAVITTDFPGCRDAIIPDKTGLLVPGRDTEALVKAIIYLIKNQDIRKSFGKAGRAFAVETFDINKIVAKHLEIYRKLLN